MKLEGVKGGYSDRLLGRVVIFTRERFLFFFAKFELLLVGVLVKILLLDPS